MQIQAYLQQLSEDYPDIVEFTLFQSTYDANALSLVKIGQRTVDRPVIFIECGIHAREWIAPATCLYIIQELVENEDNRNMIENVDWYIIPVVNPDGYEYSHTTVSFKILYQIVIPNCSINNVQSYISLMTSKINFSGTFMEKNPVT